MDDTEQKFLELLTSAGLFKAIQYLVNNVSEDQMLRILKNQGFGPILVKGLFGSRRRSMVVYTLESRNLIVTAAQLWEVLTDLKPDDPRFGEVVKKHKEVSSAILKNLQQVTLKWEVPRS